MDLTPFKLDIDELLEEFTQENLSTLADMKRLWKVRKFSYIYEAKPTSNSAFFMQSLFAHSISYMVSDGSLSQKLGGLYCLYCLYETQPYKPCFKIYLSLGELKRLKALVIDAKVNGIGVVPALTRRMLDRNMFLFGFVDIAGGSINQRVDEMIKLQNRRCQVAYEKLLANTRIEGYLLMDIDAELELKSLQKMSKDYATAKELAIKEATHVVEVDDIKHIAEHENLVGDRVEEIVQKWDAQKEAFCKESGISSRNEIVPFDQVDEFAELEHLLSE